MTRVLQWIETDSQYIAVLQPREIFDEDSFFEDRHKYEAIILGRRKDTGETDWHAHSYEKEWVSLAQAQAWMAAAEEIVSAERQPATEAILAVYEHGTFRPLERIEGLEDGQRVRLQVVPGELGQVTQTVRESRADYKAEHLNDAEDGCSEPRPGATLASSVSLGTPRGGALGSCQ